MPTGALHTTGTLWLFRKYGDSGVPAGDPDVVDLVEYSGGPDWMKSDTFLWFAEDAIWAGSRFGQLAYEIDRTYLNPKVIEAVQSESQKERQRLIRVTPVLYLQAVHPRIIAHWISVWDDMKAKLVPIYDEYLSRFNSGEKQYEMYADWVSVLIENAEINRSILDLIQKSKNASIPELRAIHKAIAPMVEKLRENQDTRELFRSQPSAF